MKKLVILIAFLSFACSGDDSNEVICTEDIRAGLAVTVKDAGNGAILIGGVTVTATDGAYTEELESTFGNSVFTGAYERAGNYVLTVSKEGYQTFTSETIEVGEDECHVITEEVTVVLQPE